MRSLRQVPRPSETRNRFAALAVLSLFVLAGLAALQVTSAQSPHVTAVPSIPVSPIHWLETGAFSPQHQAILDDCFYLELQASGATAVAPSNYDLRLANCEGRTAMTLVGDADTAEKGHPVGPTNHAPAVRVAYADVNSDGVTDPNDNYYLTTAPGDSLAHTSGNNFTLRLKPAGGKAAGTTVIASDSDFTSYGAAAPTVVASLTWHDHDQNTAFTPGDSLYMLLGLGPGYGAGRAMPPNALLLAGPPAPVDNGWGFTSGDSLGFTPIHWLDFGPPGASLEDCFYSELQQHGAAPTAPSVSDLRLVSCQGSGAFTMVRADDTVERTYPNGTGNSAPRVRLAYADVNNNGYRDFNDWMFFTTRTEPFLGATQGGNFTIRLTATSANAAGTLVLAGDSDLVSYGSVAPTVTGSIGWTDRDGDSSITESDALWLMVGVDLGSPANTIIPAGSIKLRGGTSPSPFPSPSNETGPTPVISQPPISPEPTPSVGSGATSAHVEPGSLAFDTLEGRVGDEVRLYGRIVNPTDEDVEMQLIVRAVYQNSTTDHSNVFGLRVLAGRELVFHDQWTPSKRGHYGVFAELQPNAKTLPVMRLASGAAGGDKAVLWVGSAPSTMPQILLNANLEEQLVLEENGKRTIPLEVTAYNGRATNVRLDVYTADGVKVRSLTPATSIEAGATVRFYLETTADEIDGSDSSRRAKIELRALSDHVSSNVDTLDIVVQAKAPRSNQAIGPELAAVGIATAGALAAAFAAATETGRWSILRRLLKWAPFLFLFSRVSGPKVLDHRLREQIYQHIQQRPGTYYRSILKELNLAHGTLSHHLYTLERAELIKSQRHGVRVRFFPAGLGAIKTRPLNPWQLRVMELIRSTPGISQVDLARRLGVTKQALHYHVSELRRASLLAVGMAGRDSQLSLAPGAWGRVGRCVACGNGYEAQAGALQLRCAVCHAEITGKVNV